MSLLIGVPKEVFPGEKRVATVPEVVEKLIKQGFRVAVEAGAGDAAQINDDAYRAAGAEVVADRPSCGRRRTSYSRCARLRLRKSGCCARGRCWSASSGRRRTRT